MELVRDIAFTSKEFSDAWQIEKVKIDFSQTDIDNIKKASSIIKENKFIENIRVAVSSDVTLLADEDEEVTSWEYDTIQFIVYDDVVYLYAQSKDDSADQIESEPFEIIML
jgi:hypothetical protein